MTREKVNLVREHAPSYGLNQTLAALGLLKSTWYYWEREKKNEEDRHSPLREPLMKVLEDHPEYGYRRIAPEMKAQGAPGGRDGGAPGPRDVGLGSAPENEEAEGVSPAGAHEAEGAAGEPCGGDPQLSQADPDARQGEEPGIHQEESLVTHQRRR